MRAETPLAGGMRSVLITGCSSGIGATVARGLTMRGWRVFATARKPEDVERLQAEGMESLLLDLNDSASIHAAVDVVLERTGGKLDAALLDQSFGYAG